MYSSLINLLYSWLVHTAKNSSLFFFLFFSSGDGGTPPKSLHLKFKKISFSFWLHLDSLKKAIPTLPRNFLRASLSLSTSLSTWLRRLLPRRQGLRRRSPCIPRPPLSFCWTLDVQELKLLLMLWCLLTKWWVCDDDLLLLLLLLLLLGHLRLMSPSLKDLATSPLSKIQLHYHAPSVFRSIYRA